MIRALALLPLFAARASACAVCFGGLGNAKGLADGFWWGIIGLIAATFSMVAGIGWLLWKVERSRAAEAR